MKEGTFKLARNALRDVAEIVTYLHREASPSVADKLEGKLFAAFSALSHGTAVGHTRTDLTDKRVLFYVVGPYVIVHRKAPTTTYIVRVIHTSRDLKRLLW